MTFNYGSMNEVFKIMSIHGSNIGENTLQIFHASLPHIHVVVHKLMPIATEGVPAMSNENARLI
jgi:hypothetical protein